MTRRQPASLGLVAATLVAFAAAGVHFSRPPESRALRVGMTLDEARAAIGRPLAYGYWHRPTHRWVYRWDGIDGGPGLWVAFDPRSDRVESWAVVRPGPPRLLDRVLGWVGL